MISHIFLKIIMSFYSFIYVFKLLRSHLLNNLEMLIYKTECTRFLMNLNTRILLGTFHNHLVLPIFRSTISFLCFQ